MDLHLGWERLKMIRLSSVGYPEEIETKVKVETKVKIEIFVLSYKSERKTIANHKEQRLSILICKPNCL